MRIVFDLDGTLIDSVGSLCAAGNTLLSELGRDPIDTGTYAGFVGRGVPKQVISLLNHTGGIPGSDSEPHVRRFREIYDADPVTGCTAYPGARGALLTLSELDCGIGVCTQKPEAPARMVLSALSMMPPIREVTGGDTVPGVLKPDRRLLDHASHALGDGPLVYVGDSEVDAETAVNAGVSFVLVAWGYKATANEDIPHDYLIRDFSELPEVVRAISAG